MRYYSTGVHTVEANLRTWNTLAGEVDPERFQEARANLEKEVAEARWWRDASLLYWQTFSRLPIPAGYEQPLHSLAFYEQQLRCPADRTKPRCPAIEETP